MELRLCKIAQIIFIFCFCGIKLSAQNPFITHIYAADPSAHVWKNDTNMLWLILRTINREQITMLPCLTTMFFQQKIW